MECNHTWWICRLRNEHVRSYNQMSNVCMCSVLGFAWNFFIFSEVQEDQSSRFILSVVLMLGLRSKNDNILTILVREIFSRKLMLLSRVVCHIITSNFICVYLDWIFAYFAYEEGFWSIDFINSISRIFTCGIKINKCTAVDWHALKWVHPILTMAWSVEDAIDSEKLHLLLIKPSWKKDVNIPREDSPIPSQKKNKPTNSTT